MLDNLFFVILILNATGLFAFLAPQLGVKIGFVSLGFLGLQVIYLGARQKYLVLLLRRAEMRGWLFVLLIWPVFSALYAPALEVREIGLQLYYVSLLYGTVVYVVANGLGPMRRVIVLSIVITMFGLVLSIMAPEYFKPVSDLSSAEFEKEGRACGFLLQPNQLAMTTNFLFVAWFMLSERKGALPDVAAIMVLLFAILLTGSRTGIVVAMVIVTTILVSFWKGKLATRRFLLKMGVLTACLTGGAIGMRYYLSQIQCTDARTGDLVNRMETMLSFKLTNAGSIRDDGSVRDRLEGQEVYWSLIYEKPLLGHGLGSNAWYQESGLINITSHSEALRCAMEYGSLYPIVFSLWVVLLCFKNRRDLEERILRSHSVSQFASVTLILFFVNGGLFDNRTFIVVFGMVLAAVYFPARVPSYDRPVDIINRSFISNDNLGHLLRRRQCARPERPSSYVGSLLRQKKEIV